MNLFENYKALVKETFLVKNFKKLSVAEIVFVSIILSPFIAAYAALLIGYGAILVLYRFISAPVDFLLDFIHVEGKEVKHATQAIVYFVCLPFVFFLKVFLSFLMFELFVVHAITSLVGYIATFGGISFYPFLLSQGDRFTSYDTKPFKNGLVLTFIVLGLIFVFFITVFKPLTNLLVDSINNQSTYTYDYEGEFEDFQQRVELEYRNDFIGYRQYNDFRNAIDDGTINVNNYQDYYFYYFQESYTQNSKYYIYEHFGNNYEVYETIETIYTISLIGYFLFVIIYVPTAFRLKHLKEVEE